MFSESCHDVVQEQRTEKMIFSEDREDCLVLHSLPPNKLINVQEAELHLYLPSLVNGNVGDVTSILVGALQKDQQWFHQCDIRSPIF